MNTKHTPGPWRQSTANPNAVNKDGEKLAIGIATTHGTDDSNYAAFFPSTDEAKANARLIAAAPELLEALIRAEQALADIINAADNGQPYTAAELAENFLPDNDAAREAIAKAKATL